MLEVFNDFRDMSLLSIVVRVFLAALCGGIIGMEREYRRQPAGFRTHMLICLGAAITIMTSQHIVVHMKLYTDMGRLGAQVVAGIGFIGTGAIVKTKGKTRGITTAAGLWTAAVIGLAVGIGFYEAAFLCTILVLIAEGILPGVERYINKGMSEINLYLEYENSDCYVEVIHYLQCRNLKILNREIARAKKSEKHSVCAIFMIRLNKGYTAELVKAELKKLPGIEQCEII